MIQRTFNLLFLVFLMAAAMPTMSFAKTDTTDALRVLGEIPIQQGGRVKPFASFAKEVALYVTGKARFNKIPATQLVWEWMTQPEKWNTEPIVPVSYKPLKEELGLLLIDKRISPELALGQRSFLEKVQASIQRRDQKEKLSDLERKRVEIYEKALFFRRIGEGVAPGWLAHPQDVNAAWLPFRDLMAPESLQSIGQFYDGKQLQVTLNALRQTFLEFRDPQTGGPKLATAQELKSGLKGLFQSRGVILDERVLNLEVQYHRLEPFNWAWKSYFLAGILGVIAVVLSLFSAQGASRIFSWVGLAFFIAGFALHTYGFYLRCVIAGRPPVSNMYESVIWVSWGVAFFAFVLSYICRAQSIQTIAAFVATLALLIAQSFPALMDPSLAPLVPVLRSNLWLTVHVLTITLSYAAFALAWGIGHGAVYRFAFKPEQAEQNQQLVIYLYRAVQIGVVLLAAGTVLGGVWANYSWGRFWGWDPKETWALIALLGYILILHGRFAGWLGAFGFAAGTIVAFLGIVMAWYGVNYVLAAGLHSYGFGGGGAGYVLGVAVFDLLLVLLATRIYKARQTGKVLAK